MSNVLTLLFAPTFLILIKYFEFKTVSLVYIFLSLLFLFYTYLRKKAFEDFVIITIYLVLLLFAYSLDSFEVVKYIPVFSAMTFCLIFIHSYIKKNEIILKFTTRFYKKELSKGEILFLKEGDLFWAIAIFIYSMLLISLIYYNNDSLWAFFSSIGWYIYFIVVLSIQILYGKIYAIKMYSK